MTSAELTPRQAEVLAFVERFIGKQGYPPSLLDICRSFGWASNHAAYIHVTALCAKGYLSRSEKTSRGLRLIRRRSNV
jgi:repressor LexA